MPDFSSTDMSGNSLQLTPNNANDLFIRVEQRNVDSELFRIVLVFPSTGRQPWKRSTHLMLRRSMNRLSFELTSSTVRE